MLVEMKLVHRLSMSTKFAVQEVCRLSHVSVVRGKLKDRLRTLHCCPIRSAQQHRNMSAQPYL